MGASDRIQLIDYPYALPSKCAICGSGPETERKFVDFGLQLDYYGAVYFCSLCMCNVAELLGYVTPAKYNATAEELFAQNNSVIILEGENEEFRRVFATLHGLGALLPDGTPNVVGSSVSNEDDAKSASKPVQKPRRKEPRTDKYSSSEGSGNVSESHSDSANAAESGDSDDDFSF